MYVRCDESSLYRINYVHSPDGELRWECPGIKTMHTGFSAYTYCIMPTLQRLMEELDVMI